MLPALDRKHWDARWFTRVLGDQGYPWLGYLRITYFCIAVK